MRRYRTGGGVRGNIAAGRVKVLKTTLPEVSDEHWVELLSLNPRKIFGLPQPTVQENAVANLTLFQPSAQWAFTKDKVKSRSQNSPFIDKKFTGRVAGIINGEKIVLNNR